MRCQVIGFVLPHPKALLSTRIPIERELGIKESDESAKLASRDVKMKRTPPSEDSSDLETEKPVSNDRTEMDPLKEMKNLDLDYVP